MPLLNVEAARRDQGKSQHDVSQLTGISQTDVSSIERGRKKPTEEERVLLGRALKFSPERLTKPVSLGD